HHSRHCMCHRLRW
ncbi:hypothetical protein ECEC1849_3328, partial [Escherichia coli EC1849]